MDGRARVYGRVGVTKTWPWKVWCTIDIPVLFTENVKVAVADLGSQGLDLASVHLASDIPFLGVRP